MSWKRWCEPGATMPRRTIERVAELSGVGLHTGATTRVSLQPGAAEQGVRFRRSDLPARPEVQARVAEVEATERRTAIGRGDTTIHTVEHLLAAVMALDLDDLVIELDGPEPPILDGSFEPWLNALDSAGIRTLPGDPTTYRITRPFTISEGEASYVVAPADRLLGHHRGQLPQGPGPGPHLRILPRSRRTQGPGAAQRGLDGLRGGALGDRADGRPAALAGRVRPPQGRRYPGRSRPGGRPGPGPRGGQSSQPPGQRRGGADDLPHRLAQRRADPRHQPDSRGDPPPLSLRDGGTDSRAGAPPPGGRHQERHHQRAVLPGPLSRPPGDARGADHRVDGPGRRHAADGRAGRRRGQGGVLHVARQREVPPSGGARRPAPLRSGDAPVPGQDLPAQGRGLRGRPGGGRSGDAGPGGGPVSPRIHPSAVVDRDAELAHDIEVGPFAIIGPGVSVGPDCRIGAHATLERNVRMAAGVRVGQGSVLGGDPQDLKYRGEETWVEIGEGTVIREYTTI